jgi:hypothetical protein
MEQKLVMLYAGHRRGHFMFKISKRILAAVAVYPILAGAQTELRSVGPGGVRLLNSDLAVLIDEEDRKDLPCEVSSLKPQMAFDLRFHAGYTVALPLKALASAGGRLRVLFRVTPVAKPENEVYFFQRFSIPPIESDTRGEAYLPGEFTLGPGRYSVDWLLRDGGGRVCSSHWQLEAELDDDYARVPLPIGPDTAAEAPQDAFHQPPPVERAMDDRPLHVKLLVNFSPANPDETTLKPWDLRAIVLILRGITREPQIGRFSLVAFSLAEEKVIYRQDDVPSIDFPALGEAVSALTFGTVDYQRLQDPMSAPRFLAGLLTEAPAAMGPGPDAVVLIGPKAMLKNNIPQRVLADSVRPNCPIFYLNYNPSPRRNPWRDAIGAALKVFRGLEYSITYPADLASALKDMMFRLHKPLSR